MKTHYAKFGWLWLSFTDVLRSYLPDLVEEFSQIVWTYEQLYPDPRFRSTRRKTLQRSNPSTKASAQDVYKNPAQLTHLHHRRSNSGTNHTQDPQQAKILSPNTSRGRSFGVVAVSKGVPYAASLALPSNHSYRRNRIWKMLSEDSGGCAIGSVRGNTSLWFVLYA